MDVETHEEMGEVPLSMHARGVEVLQVCYVDLVVDLVEHAWRKFNNQL